MVNLEKKGCGKREEGEGGWGRVPTIFPVENEYSIKIQLSENNIKMFFIFDFFLQKSDYTLIWIQP